MARVVVPNRDGMSLGSGTLVETSGDLGLVVTAWAPDGTAEAVEAADDRPVAGIQWHHEFHYAADAGRSTPFDDLVEAARGR